MKTDEQHKLECEARHWKLFARTHGRQQWNDCKGRLLKKRGKAGLQKLLDEMNRKDL